MSSARPVLFSNIDMSGSSSMNADEVEAIGSGILEVGLRPDVDVGALIGAK